MGWDKKIGCNEENNESYYIKCIVKTTLLFPNCHNQNPFPFVKWFDN